jgi:hypothetical protein
MSLPKKLRQQMILYKRSRLLLLSRLYYSDYYVPKVKV